MWYFVTTQGYLQRRFVRRLVSLCRTRVERRTVVIRQALTTGRDIGTLARRVGCWCDLNAPACDDPATACELFPVWASDGDPDFEWLGACVLPGSFE